MNTRKFFLQVYSTLPEMAQVILMDNEVDLEKLLNDGADIRKMDFTKFQISLYGNLRYLSPLCFAAMVGSINAVKIFLEKGADPYYQAPYQKAIENGYPEIAHLLPPCFSLANWFNEFLLALGYPFTQEYKDGVCFGISKKAGHGHLSNELSKLNNRVELMYLIYKNSEQETLKEFNFNYDTEGLFNLDRYLTNENLVKHIRRKIKNRVENDRNLNTEIHAFCDGIILCQVSQHPIILQELFENYSQKSSHQRTQLVSNLIKPIAIDNYNAMNSVGYFTGAYFIEELVTFFKILKEAIIKFEFTNNISFTLFGLSNLSPYHAIEIGFSPNGEIYFTDGGYMPSRIIQSLQDLANTITCAFNTYDFAIFSTTPITIQDEQEKLNHCLESLWQQQEWQEIHEVTEEKIALRTNLGLSWRHLAIGVGDPITVLEIDTISSCLSQLGRKTTGAIIGGGLLGALGFSLFPVAIGAVTVAKLVQTGLTLCEYKIATDNSFINSTLPQQSFNDVVTYNKNNKDSFINKKYLSFIESWQEKHSLEDEKIGSMLQNRVLR